MKVLVTGASKGLGLALVKQALSLGHQVVAVSRTPKSLLDDLSANERALTQAVSMPPLLSENAGDALEAIEELGSFDVVFNNAGLGLFGPLEELSRSDLNDLFELNVFFPLGVMRIAAAQMRRQGSGVIVNTHLIGFGV